MKTYCLRMNIGKARYVVDFHDGVKTHKDGSPFLDIRIFRNKKDTARFISDLKSEGYVCQS